VPRSEEYKAALTLRPAEQGPEGVAEKGAQEIAVLARPNGKNTMASPLSVQTAHRIPFPVEAGSPHPLGAAPSPSGVNFSLYSANATGVELLLFSDHDSLEPFQTIRFDPYLNKTFHFWHVFVRGLKPGVHYAYRVDGPSDFAGQRFNRNKILIDPYAHGNSNSLWNRGSACTPEDNLRTSIRSVVIDDSGYDWEGDKPLNRPMAECIIYEAHVRGFTQSPTSGVRHPGTFAGLIEKIPYLVDLGITAVELLPIFDFDETAVLRVVDGKPVTIIGDTALSATLRRSPPIASSPKAAATYASSAIWSRLCTRRALKSFSMWSSTTQTKATTMGRRILSAASITALTICWCLGTRNTTWIIPGAGTPSIATTPLPRN
jgi:predicted carbohydrate-binding protein with CBM48